MISSVFLYLNSIRLPNHFLQISHRGASAYELEHSLDAYLLALDQGSDYLELDVQLTKDLHLVIIHDVIPKFGDGRRVDEYTLRELQAAYRSAFGRPLLTAEEVFQTFSNAQYYIETKTDSQQLDKRLLRLIKSYQLEQSTIIQSFHQNSLKWFQKHFKQIPRIQLLTKQETTELTRGGLFGIRRYADGIGVHNTSFVLSDITKIHQSQLDVHVYTVDDAKRMAELIEAGVDGIFTNRPDVLNQVINNK